MIKQELAYCFTGIALVLGLFLVLRFCKRSIGVLHARLRTFGSGYSHPDYFKLSGVPAPKPLPDFDVDKTKPRPYRPFRWTYHQNMCTSLPELAWCVFTMLS